MKALPQAEVVEHLCDWLAGLDMANDDQPSGKMQPSAEILGGAPKKSVQTIRGLGPIACVPRAEIQLVQTHISWVILAGDWAFKLKKEIQTDFLDYSNLAKRFSACCKEYQLNRRTAPDIYLGVVVLSEVSAFGVQDAPGSDVSGISDRDSQIEEEDSATHASEAAREKHAWTLELVEIESGRVMPEGVLESAVVMRRFPEDSLLGIRLAKGLVEPSEIDQLARTLADFHEQAERSESSSSWGESQIVHHDQLDNLEHLRHWITDPSDLPVFNDLDQWVRRSSGALSEVFTERKRCGMVRACHGDLHVDNIVVWRDHWVPFDGIEFSERLRWIDVQSDLAFTVMDLFAHGEEALAHRLLNAYLERTGDYWGLAVQRWYQVYRALVRAKVAAIRADQQDVGSGEALRHAADVSRGLRLAQRLTQGKRRPGLVITHGLSGSGKSFLSQQWVDRFGAVRIRSDVERKRLFARSLDGPGELDARSAVGNLYDTTATEATYERLLHLAREGIQAGYEMIVDATFLRRRDRERFREMAQECAVPFGILCAKADKATLVKRLVDRQNRGDDPSDAGVSVLEKQLASVEDLGYDEWQWVVGVDD